jgi:hypothetical protein
MHTAHPPERQAYPVGLPDVRHDHQIISRGHALLGGVLPAPQPGRVPEGDVGQFRVREDSHPVVRRPLERRCLCLGDRVTRENQVDVERPRGLPADTGAKGGLGARPARIGGGHDDHRSPLSRRRDRDPAAFSGGGNHGPAPGKGLENQRVAIRIAEPGRRVEPSRFAPCPQLNPRQVPFGHRGGVRGLFGFDRSAVASQRGNGRKQELGEPDGSHAFLCSLRGASPTCTRI